MSTKKRAPDGFTPIAEELAAGPLPERYVEELNMTAVDLPTGPFKENQCRPQHINLQLTAKQGRALQRLHNGLNLKYPTPPGWARPGYTYADVVRWLLDQLPD